MAQMLSFVDAIVDIIGLDESFWSSTSLFKAFFMYFRATFGF